MLEMMANWAHLQELQSALADPGGGAEEDSGDAAEGDAVPVQLQGELLQQAQQHSIALGTYLREQQQRQQQSALFQSFTGDFTILVLVVHPEMIVHQQPTQSPIYSNTPHQSKWSPPRQTQKVGSFFLSKCEYGINFNC